jgi:hypothetical protein
MKCRLKPLRRSDYSASFSESEWSALQSVFGEGVCDFSKPGIGYQDSVPWLTYEHGPGGRSLGFAPASRPGRPR